MYLKKIYKRKKGNDKGFTLVELIIVVTILAVLVGMLAPQYTKYVEKSRRAADMSNMDKIIKSIQMAAIDPEYYSMIKPNSTYKESFYQIKITEEGTDIGKKDYATQGAHSIRNRDLNMSKAMNEYYGKSWSSVTMKSHRWDSKYKGPDMKIYNNAKSFNGFKCILAEIRVSPEGQISVVKYEPPAFAEAMTGRS